MTAHKIMLLGDIGVGKSSIVQRLVFDRFDFNYKPTIGVDVYRYEVPASDTRGQVSLIVWDTDGNLSDLMFRHVYMKAASAAMIVGDLTRRDTLDTMVRLAQGLQRRASGPARHISAEQAGSRHIAGHDRAAEAGRRAGPRTPSSPAPRAA